MLADHAGVGDARQQQRIGPNQDAGGHAGDGAGAVPRRQTSPPKNAGANCAMAANDSSPIAASCAGAGRAIIDVSQEQDGKDRDAAHGQKLRAGVAWFAGARARRLSTSGITMSFDTMMASATDSTITMAVAAERPPTKATSVNSSECARKRQRQHEHVAVDAAGREGQQAGHRDRHARTD